MPSGYDWLEDLEDPRVKAFIEEQNRRFREFVSPLADALYQRALELHSLPYVVDAALFEGGLYALTRERGTFTVKRYSTGDAEPQTVLDARELGGDAVVASISASRDGRMLAALHTRAGSDYARTLIVDTETGERIEGPEGYVSPPVWLTRERFLYVRTYRSGTAPDGVEAPASRVFEAELGAGEELVFGEGLGTNWLVHLAGDGESVYAVAFHGWSRSLVYELAGGGFRLLYDPGGSKAYPVGRLGGRSYVLSYEHSLGQVVEVGRGARVILRAEAHPIEDAAPVGGRLLAVRLVDGANRLELYSPEGEPAGEVGLGEGPGSVTILSRGFGAALARYESFDTPSKLYLVDQGGAWLVEGSSLPLGLEVRELWVSSRDGTRVHGFEVRSRAARDGGVAVVYGYGGFALSVKPRFQPEAVMLLEAGATFVSTNLRGGFEYGEEWHRAGMRGNKVRVFEDFGAFLEHYRARGYMTVATGRSNGGLLVAAVVARRPELIDVALAGYPLTDMLRYHRLHLGRLWTTEYGDPDDPEDRRVLESYSPIHNLKPADYPYVLAYTGLADDRVHPSHALKLTARLLDLGAPAYLRVETRSGHLGATPEVRARETAELVAFTLKALEEQRQRRSKPQAAQSG
ncbi:prolyl oligopeptidase family serine peptidase [Infirmifilum sp. NZ]|uniref:prolyl oligopeptidase family serine peptidase n=1 Tax=Infirmifilum sp. NZ TaxID=2926850 RepID=UPI00279B9985|nr:prolyl oligopeptidase family serine peptidase [Infirmifilum sp. NZ]UNQ73465.1 prolyl oligopeptidase family serine peptidase [Infirmifilum sp. NZ]